MQAVPPPEHTAAPSQLGASDKVMVETLFARLGGVTATRLGWARSAGRVDVCRERQRVHLDLGSETTPIGAAVRYLVGRHLGHVFLPVLVHEFLPVALHLREKTRVCIKSPQAQSTLEMLVHNSINAIQIL